MNSDSEILSQVSTRIRILAYLGELRRSEFIPVRQLIFDLNLRFTTAKNVLSQLEEEWIVEKRIETTRGTIALFRIAPTAVMVAPPVGVAALMQTSHKQTGCEQRVIPFVPPEWSAEYGKHPYGL